MDALVQEPIMERIFKTASLGLSVIAISLFIAIVYGTLFALNYSQPIDAQLGLVFYILAFLTCLFGVGSFRLISWCLRGNSVSK